MFYFQKSEVIFNISFKIPKAKPPTKWEQFAKVKVCFLLSCDSHMIKYIFVGYQQEKKIKDGV